MHSCLPHGCSWGMGSCYCGKSWNCPKLTTICHPRLPWKLQAFNKLQISNIVTSDRFCQCNFCLDGETDSWHILLHMFCEFPPDRLYSLTIAPLHIPTSIVWGLQFLHILPQTFYYLSQKMSFDQRPSGREGLEKQKRTVEKKRNWVKILK